MANYKYPDPLAPYEVKIKKEYGLEYAKFIAQEWISNGKLSAKIAKYKEYEAFKNNEVDLEKYKHILGMCDTTTWIGMNWAFTPIAPKFVNVIKDGFATDLFKIQTRAVDAISQKERKEFRRKLEDNMLTADFTKRMSMATGIDYSPQYVPESKEEIDIHMQLKYKQPREIASELIINRILDCNNWNETKNRIIEDIITDGIGISKITPDKDYGVVVDRVDPQDFVYSYDTKSSRNKKGCFYFGEIKKYSPGEIIKLSNGEIKKDILSKHASLESNHDEDWLDNQLVDVIYFCFKTTIGITYKKKWNKLTRKPSNFKLHPESKSEVIKGEFDVWFEGYHVLGSDLIWGYRLMRDMIRPTHNIAKVLPPYSVYELSVPSVISNIIPFCEDAHIAVLKLRHLIISAKPKGFQIDIDAISNIDLGGGELLKPIEVIKIYDQTGRLLTSSKKFDDLDKDYSQAIRDINSSLGTDLMQLINVYNNAINMCYEVSGLNRVRDGSAPLNGALVGTQQIALSMSNTATKHILNAILGVEKDVSEIVLNRAQQLSMYGDRFADEIMESFLEEEDKVEKELYSSHKYRFDVVVVIAPDQNERQALEININNALQSNQISLSDAIDIKTIPNIKLANEWLKITIKKRQKEARINEQMAIREQQMARAQADIAIEQAKMQTINTNAQLEQIKAQAAIAINNAKVEKETEGKLILMSKKHRYDMELKGLEVKATTELNKFKEDSKDNRTKIQADQQSRMIFQRQNGTPPEQFSTTSPLTGIDNLVQRNGHTEYYDPNTLYGNTTFNESGILNTPTFLSGESEQNVTQESDESIDVQ